MRGVYVCMLGFVWFVKCCWASAESTVSSAGTGRSEVAMAAAFVWSHGAAVGTTSLSGCLSLRELQCFFLAPSHLYPTQSGFRSGQLLDPVGGMACIDKGPQMW